MSVSLSITMDSDEDEYPALAADDGELSFSRWRSNQRPPPPPPLPPHSTHPLDPEGHVDFHSQLDSVTSDETEKLSSGIGLSNRRGVAMSISPHRHVDDAWNKIGLGSDSPVGTPGSGCVQVSDQEFEREFGFHSATPGKLEAGAIERRHMLRMDPDWDSRPAEDDCQSHGSSELSFQDMVERHDGGRHFSSERGPIFVVFLRTMALIMLWYFFSTGLTM